MTTKVAPWLEGLSEVWEVPAKPTIANNISSASHDASSLRSNGSRIPRRSLSGLPSSLPRHDSTSHASTQRKRNPLATLNSNDANSLYRPSRNAKLAGTRSVSEASDGSGMACGTVQKRSKSSSPTKKQQTLEWKRRLVHGQVGYGDQTDLFGPSGLENIFARSNDAENEAPKPKKRMAWLKNFDVTMPSSPPPWPSSFRGQVQQQDQRNALSSDSAAEEDQRSRPDGQDAEASFLSNPFDLEDSREVLDDILDRQQTPSPCRSSPDKAFVEPTQAEVAANRTISGQTELEQEDFSPVFISKHHTVSGQVDYAALDSHTIKQFQSMKINLRHPSQAASGQGVLDQRGEGEEYLEVSRFSDQLETQSLPAAPDLSFSENLPTGSPFPNLDKNVQLRRGGYSQCGSFKQRPLSPSQSALESLHGPNASGVISPMPSDSMLLPPAPTPPKTPGRAAQQEEPKSRSSGSPLKLFGNHDTFTNNRLLRRLSQLNPDGTIRQPPAHLEEHQAARKISSGSSFGNGDLDHHSFDAEITITSASDSDKDDSDGSPGSEIPVPGSKTPLGFRFEVSPEVKDTFRLKRKLSKHSATTSKASTLESQFKPKAEPQPSIEEVAEARRQAEHLSEHTRCYGEGKRPPTSPFKNPTPKRRRTLHASELENHLTNANISYHNQLQEAVSSRKRKDARHGESQNVADPDTLAQRKILRPRNPTPSQRRRQQIEAEVREAAEEFAVQEPERLEAVMEQIESSMASDVPQTLQQQAHALAAEVANFTFRVQKPSGEHGERKRSVTTQDFFDEAMMVMNLIRAKARPQSNLGSVEESDGEALAQSLRIDESHRSESLLRVSRPPSREGSGWRPRVPVQTDARVISHLRKFQEREMKDDTDFIANSIASLQVDDEEHVNEQVVVVDEHSNIRITGPLPGREEMEADSRPVSQRSHGSTLHTQNSAGTSTERTIGTSSTRKSENVGNLAPDAVAHLIGEQVGGMTFDKEKQRWVRISKSPEKGHGSFLELPSNVTSDDDPFREISDLPVDEHKEKRRISSPTRVVDLPGQADRTTSVHDQAFEKTTHAHVAESRTSSNETVIPRPVTQDSSHIQHLHSSSVPSRYTAFGSSQQEKFETRATSWSDEELAKMSALGRNKQQRLSYVAETVSTQRSEHLRDQAAPNDRSNPRLHHSDKNVEAIDSGQIAADVANHRTRDRLAGLRDDTALELGESDVEEIVSPKLRQPLYRQAYPPPPTARTATRQMSLRRKTLTNGFISEAHETSELSFVAPLPGDRIMSVSLSVSRPRSNQHQQVQIDELQSSPSKGNPSFLLSDLPDFTVHELDEERSSEQVLATRLAQHAATTVNDRYALAVNDLVKILTDANVDEPYWEDLKQLDLRGQSLASLYGLDDFCTNVQETDVSSNALTHLHGAPATIRRLKARSNQLSSLTSWNHMVNLQYLDISNNHLDSLDGLSGLIHLRELRADDNAIAGLEGIFGLDGLLKLRMRRNKVKNIRFDRCGLSELTALDLSENHISSVSKLDQLRSLAQLNLNGNDLRCGLQIEGAMSQLISLSLQRCHTQQLDVSPFPNLEHLAVDDNSLAKIEGIRKLTNLLTLSMKRQSLLEAQAMSIFDQPLNARTVRLSGSPMPSMILSTSFLSIQHLELASVGLQDLPDDFGLKMPNLRTLNLNYNHLEDIRPLLNIQNLEQLSVCGNKLQRLRKSVATFAKMPTLQKLDLRDNPFTHGFYANIALLASRHTSIVCKVQNPTEDEDELAAVLESSRYGHPPGDAREDKQHRARFDEHTKLRRRVYEMLLANSCPVLNTLDGLELDRAAAVGKDCVWDRLVDLGIIRRSEPQPSQLTT